jgi:hypothetical protein
VHTQTLSYCLFNDFSVATFHPKFGSIKPSSESFEFSSHGNDIIGKLCVHPEDYLRREEYTSLRTDLSSNLTYDPASPWRYLLKRMENVMGLIPLPITGNYGLKIPTLHLHTFCIDVRDFRSGTNPDTHNRDVYVTGRPKALVEIDLDVTTDGNMLRQYSFKLAIVGLGRRDNEFTEFGEAPTKTYCAILWLIRKVGFYYERVGITAVDLNDWLKLDSVELKWMAVR